MKLLIISVATILSTHCYCQSLQAVLERLVGQYSFSNKSKLDTSKHLTNLRAGTISTTIPLSDKRTGTIDSEQGELTNGELLIHYNIGFNASTHLNMGKKLQCSWYLEKIANSYNVAIGLTNIGDNSELSITVWDIKLNSPLSYPANFWGNVKDENDIKTILEMGASYRPAK